MRTHNPQYARSEYHTQLADMSFDEIILDLTAGIYIFCYPLYSLIVTFCTLPHNS